ncbi:MAG: transcriptional regulator [Flavobacteriaceae bacterium]|nr:transcriptional regulator [Flavobacteriaceae bacterium]
MLNTNKIIDRIELIRSNHQLSASAFANRIGVQRSAMSHILSGRNKPSLEFLIKVYDAFEDIDLQWLLLGTSPSLTKSEAPHASLEEDSSGENTRLLAPVHLELGVKVKAQPEKDNNEDRLKATPKEILYLYLDGSFEIYKPK